MSVIGRKEKELTFQWEKVENNENYTYILATNGNRSVPIHALENYPLVNHTVPNLSPGTNYSFTLYTVLEDMSPGLNFFGVTGK